MRKALLATFVFTLIAGSTFFATNGFCFGCGFKPFPPFGCTNANAVCTCDGSGNCGWIWIGCR